jgi:hypothetical protein
MMNTLMKRCTTATLAATLCATALSSVGCGSTEATAAEARARAEATWKLEIQGTDPLALERMDIYLVEDESEPEIFKLYGDEVTLVGEFPEDLHVGYGEALDRLIGRRIELSAEGGDPREPSDAYVTIDGRQLPVKGGTLEVNRVTGSWNGADGDKTLWGTVELSVEDGGVPRTIRGTFAVHAVSWG